MGNPPFVGFKNFLNKEQRIEMAEVLMELKMEK